MTLPRLVCILALLALLTANAFAADPKPPPPNPADPVDYYAWMNNTLGGDLDDNAYDAYVRVYDQIEPFEGDWGDTLYAPWSDNPPVSNWLAGNRGALLKFRRVARKRDCLVLGEMPEPTGDPRIDGLLFRLELFELSKHRAACKGLIADGFRAWSSGDHKRLPQNASLVLRSGRHFDSSPILIARLVGVSCAAMSYRSMRVALNLSPEPGELAVRFLHDLEADDPPWPSLERPLFGERLMAWDICQRAYKPGPKPGTWTFHRPTLQMISQGLPALDFDGLAPRPIPFEETLSEFDACYDVYADWARTPYHQAPEGAEQVDRLTEKSSNMLVKTLVPSLSRARVLNEMITTERRATHLICYLWAHRADAGAFPASLDELQAPNLPDLRVDSFNGRDLVYRSTAASFTLYTVGKDLDDDGGRHDRRWGEKTGGDFVFWPVQDAR
jgi:hypothetical protein